MKCEIDSTTGKNRMIFLNLSGVCPPCKEPSRKEKLMDTGWIGGCGGALLAILAALKISNNKYERSSRKSFVQKILRVLVAGTAGFIGGSEGINLVLESSNTADSHQLLVEQLPPIKTSKIPDSTKLKSLNKKNKLVSQMSTVEKSTNKNEDDSQITIKQGDDVDFNIRTYVTGTNTYGAWALPEKKPIKDRKNDDIIYRLFNELPDNCQNILDILYKLGFIESVFRKPNVESNKIAFGVLLDKRYYNSEEFNEKTYDTRAKNMIDEFISNKSKNENLKISEADSSEVTDNLYNEMTMFLKQQFHMNIMWQFDTKFFNETIQKFLKSSVNIELDGEKYNYANLFMSRRSLKEGKQIYVLAMCDLIEYLLANCGFSLEITEDGKYALVYTRTL